MLNLNLKVRVKNPTFWIGLASVIASPILAYNGAQLSDFTTWGSVGHVIVETVKNPYLVGSIVSAVLGFIGVTVDPTTKGISDSETALTYDKPKED